MDMTTLAAAKRYTDEKVGGSGGGGGFPVVELTTVLAAEGVVLTDAENAQLNEVAATGLPIILKCTGPDGTGVRGVATAMNFGTETVVAYILFAELVSVQVIDLNAEGVWTAMFMDHD